jgi:hypothetical protein
MFALLIPTLLSCLVLAAHFFRGGHTYLTLICCAAPLLLLVRRTWATRLLQLILVAGALEWVRTTWQIQAIRLEQGRDWQRMAVILYSVAAFTFASALVFLIPAMRRHYCPARPAALGKQPCETTAPAAPAGASPTPVGSTG